MSRARCVPRWDVFIRHHHLHRSSSSCLASQLCYNVTLLLLLQQRKEERLIILLWLFSIFYIIFYCWLCVLDRGISIYLNVIYFLTTYDCMIMNVFFFFGKKKYLISTPLLYYGNGFSERLGEASHRSLSGTGARRSRKRSGSSSRWGYTRCSFSLPAMTLRSSIRSRCVFECCARTIAHSTRPILSVSCSSATTHSLRYSEWTGTIQLQAAC